MYLLIINDMEVVIALEFRLDKYLITDYTLGGILDGKYEYQDDVYTPLIHYNDYFEDKDNWIFHNVDEIFLDFVCSHGLNNKEYILYGHSAGCQFVHRGLMLNEFKYAKKFICVAAGTWTNFDDGMFPYGISNISNLLDKNCLKKNVYILVDSLDTDKHRLENSKTVLKNGKNRLERAKYYYKSAKEYASINGREFNWKFAVLPEIKHDIPSSIPFAVDIILRG